MVKNPARADINRKSNDSVYEPLSHAPAADRHGGHAPRYETTEERAVAPRKTSSEGLYEAMSNDKPQQMHSSDAPLENYEVVGNQYDTAPAPHGAPRPVQQLSSDGYYDGEYAPCENGDDEYDMPTYSVNVGEQPLDSYRALDSTAQQYQAGHVPLEHDDVYRRLHLAPQQYQNPEIHGAIRSSRYNGDSTPPPRPPKQRLRRDGVGQTGV